jgi:hypothetical protein
VPVTLVYDLGLLNDISLGHQAAMLWFTAPVKAELKLQFLQTQLQAPH